jgi:hypothetical protein
MQQILVVLLPVDNYSRDDHAEAYENGVFESREAIFKLWPGALVYTLSDFMDECNDQELNMELYWLTYIRIK